MDDAYITAQKAYLLAIECELQGAIAENQSRNHTGDAPAYTEKHFDNLRVQAEGIANRILEGR